MEAVLWLIKRVYFILTDPVFHVLSAYVKNLCLLRSQKLTDKYSQAVVGWCKGS